MSHPDLIAAMDALKAGRPAAILRLAMRARQAAEEGRYCACAEPDVVGADLMCGACLLENQDQERRRVTALVRAHEFMPGKLGGRMCATCTMPESAPRHHGVHAVGRCSWGEEIRPA